MLLLIGPYSAPIYLLLYILPVFGHINVPNSTAELGTNKLNHLHWHIGNEPYICDKKHVNTLQYIGTQPRYSRPASDQQNQAVHRRKSRPLSGAEMVLLNLFSLQKQLINMTANANNAAISSEVDCLKILYYYKVGKKYLN